MGRTLSEMVLDFFELDGDDSQRSDELEWRSDDEDDETSAAETKAFWDSQHQLLQDSLSRRSSMETRIQRSTEEAMRESMESSPCTTCACSRECPNHCVLRHVADRLRTAGFNSAALCKSKWRKSAEIPSGVHTYVDVVVEHKDPKRRPTRIVVELNWRGEFEMVRANSEYNKLVGSLPEVFVGKSERLRGVIKIMCAAAKKCMKDKKMHVAPWRKLKYMQCKWLGPCERVVPSVVVAQAVVVAAKESDRRWRPRASMLTFDLHCPAVEVL